MAKKVIIDEAHHKEYMRLKGNAIRMRLILNVLEARLTTDEMNKINVAVQKELQKLGA